MNAIEKLESMYHSLAPTGNLSEKITRDNYSENVWGRRCCMRGDPLDVGTERVTLLLRHVAALELIDHKEMAMLQRSLRSLCNITQFAVIEQSHSRSDGRKGC